MRKPVKIDIYVKNHMTGTFDYACSTTWSKLLIQAKNAFMNAHPGIPLSDIKAVRSK